MKKTYSWNVEHRCYSTACHKIPEQHISKNRHTLIIVFFEFTTTQKNQSNQQSPLSRGFISSPNAECTSNTENLDTPR